MGRRVALIIAVLAGALAAPAGAGEALRHWPAAFTGPAQFEMTVGQVRFTVPHDRSRPSLKLSRTASLGADYLATAMPRHQPRGVLVALVLVVNRRPAGSAAADLAQVDLRATLSHALDAPRVGQLADVYTTAKAPPRSLCALQAKGAMASSSLRPLLHGGGAVPGFGTRAAVAQGFDQVCGRPVDPAFTAAVHPPAPTPTSTTPTPLPPPRLPPRCPPCGPATQSSTRIACPLTPSRPVVICPQ
jgi:hypothetical protein